MKTEKKMDSEVLSFQSNLNLLDDNAAAAASQVLEDEDCLVIDNEEDFPEGPMEGKHDDHNIPHDCEQDAEKLRVNNLLDGEDEREDEGGNSKMIEDLKTKGETVTLESDVEGENNSKKIASEVDEPKHVVMEKMNVCNNGHEGKQEANNLPLKKNAMDKKGNGGYVLLKEEEDKSDTVNMANMDGGLKKQIPKKRADYKPYGKKSSDLPAQVDDERKKTALRVLILILIMHSLPGAHADALGAHSNYSIPQSYRSCEQYKSELYNHFAPIEDRYACIEEQKNIQCKPGLESVCLLYRHKPRMFFAGCINPPGRFMDVKDCPMVTWQKENEKYIVQCYPNECVRCTDSDSVERRLSKCRDLQNKKSSCTRKEPYLWTMVFMATVPCVFTFREYL